MADSTSKTTIKNVQGCINPHCDPVPPWIGSFGGADSRGDVPRGVFGVERGALRLLDMSKRRGMKTTWSVPVHLREAAMIIEAGQEIGVHGHLQEPQRDEPRARGGGP
jgi:hypothetical protein